MIDFTFRIRDGERDLKDKCLDGFDTGRPSC